MTGAEGNALTADHLHLGGALVFRSLAKPLAGVSLASARIGVLLDEPGAWGNQIVLDGFEYQSFGGEASTNAATRLAWLDKQPEEHSGLGKDGTLFRPQPWQQLRRVLEGMGHAEEARQVAIAQEERIRRADLVGRSPTDWGAWRRVPYRLTGRAFHWSFGFLTGYGYRPIRLLTCFVAVWLICGALFWVAALKFGVFGPSNPLVFQNPNYAACLASGVTAPQERRASSGDAPEPTRGAGNWYLCQQLPEEYTGFSPLAYSLDVLLPFVDLQQQADWAPLTPTPLSSPLDEFRRLGWKQVTRLIVWLETLFGWVTGLLLAAIVSGLAKRRE